MITAERKESLSKLGFSIEDMGAWGEQFEGQYRWLNEKDVDGFGAVQYSEEAAWADADHFAKKYCCPMCGSINSHSASRDGYDNLCNNCECI